MVAIVRFKRYLGGLLALAGVGMIGVLVFSDRRQGAELAVVSTTGPDATTAAVSAAASEETLSGAASAETESLTEPLLSNRQRADELRAALAALYTEPAASVGQARDGLDRYVAEVMQTQVLPLVERCYQALLERRTGAAGNVELGFAILGNRQLGGVVVDAKLEKGTTLWGPQFASCVTEAMYALILDPPPDGHSTVSVKQSFELSP